MGIHDRIDPYARVIHLSDLDSSGPQNGDYTSDDASSVSSLPAPACRPPRRTRSSKAEALDYQAMSERLHCKSKRYAKRHNHLSMVRTLVGLEESEIEGEFAQISDNYGNSIFSSLFLEAEKMQVWNKYIEMSEEDQHLVIEGEVTIEGSRDVNNIVLVTNKPSDRRVVHPSYSSEECFHQVDQNIRHFLKKRHVPLGLVEGVEAKMRDSFHQDPCVVFQMNMETSFGRLIVHAVAQYLGLESFSVDCGDNSKVISVTNKNGDFRPPTQFLSQYLEWKSGRHQIYRD